MDSHRTRLTPFLSIILVILATASYVRATAQPSEGQDHGPLEIGDPPYSVWVGNQSECCPKVLDLRVKKTGWDKEKTLGMTGRMETLEKLQPVVKPRLLVVGKLPPAGGWDLWIANLETMKQEAEIWSYGYGVSPSGRFLAYQTHYPSRGPPNGRRSIFLLYDLSRPPDDNRTGPLSDWPEPNLGTPIFPKENVERHSWSIYEAKRFYGITSPFLWSADGSSMVFLVTGYLQSLKDRHGYIVRVDLTPDGQVRQVRQEQLSLKNLDLPYRTRPLKEIERGPMLVNLDSIAWGKDHGDGLWVVGPTSLPGDELGSKVWIRVPGQASGSEPAAKPER